MSSLRRARLLSFLISFTPCVIYSVRDGTGARRRGDRRTRAERARRRVVARRRRQGGEGERRF